MTCWAYPSQLTEKPGASAPHSTQKSLEFIKLFTVPKWRPEMLDLSSLISTKSPTRIFLAENLNLWPMNRADFFIFLQLGRLENIPMGTNFGNYPTHASTSTSFWQMFRHLGVRCLCKKSACTRQRSPTSFLSWHVFFLCPLKSWCGPATFKEVRRNRAKIENSTDGKLITQHTAFPSRKKKTWKKTSQKSVLYLLTKNGSSPAFRTACSRSSSESIPTSW